MKSRLFFYSVLLLVLASFSAVVPVFAAEQYRVVRVESWDTLNMRSGPGVKNGVVVKLPHNAVGVQLLGGSRQVGRTRWVEASWQGRRGWVSKAYLGRQTIPAAGALPQSTAPANPVVSAPLQTNQPPPVWAQTDHIVKNKQSGMWILECGSRSPYWRVEVLPEWMRGTLGSHKTGMAITHKRQKHGKFRNVALETEVRGRNKWNRLQMVLTYNRSCPSTLVNQKVPFSVTGMFNNQPISGCCRSYQVR